MERRGVFPGEFLKLSGAEREGFFRHVVWLV
jgi:hypothetical protein